MKAGMVYLRISRNVSSIVIVGFCRLKNTASESFETSLSELSCKTCRYGSQIGIKCRKQLLSDPLALLQVH
jgi:hypothetical protein